MSTYHHGFVILIPNDDIEMLHQLKETVRRKLKRTKWKESAGISECRIFDLTS